jgi:hypothetical protein
MNPHRPRKPRYDGAALKYLGQWRTYVERTERLARKGIGSDPFWDYHCCGWWYDEHGRDRLESLMRRGGRHAHRLTAAVARLDDRFRAATVEQGAWRTR